MREIFFTRQSAHLALSELLAQASQDMAQFSEVHEAVAVLVEGAQAVNELLSCARGIDFALQVGRELLKRDARLAGRIDLGNNLADL